MTPAKPASSVRIRLATLSDLWSIVALEEICFDADRWDADAYEACLKRKSTLALIAELPDVAAPVGYAISQRYKRARVEIIALAAAPEFRGHGIGTALLQHICQDSETRLVPKVSLCVRPNNAAALALYKNFGFSAKGTKLHYYEDGMSAIRMRLDLRKTL